MTQPYPRLSDAEKQLNMSSSQILQSCLYGQVELLLYIPITCKVEIQYPNGVKEQLSSISTLSPHISKISVGDYTFLVLKPTDAKILDAERKFTVLDDRCNHFSAAYKLNQSSSEMFEKISTVSDVIKAMSLDYGQDTTTETPISNDDGFLFTVDLANEIEQVTEYKPQFKLTPKDGGNTNEPLKITVDDIFIFAHEIEKLKSSQSADSETDIEPRGKKLYDEYKRRKATNESGIVESMAACEGVAPQRIHQLMKPFKHK